MDAHLTLARWGLSAPALEEAREAEHSDPERCRRQPRHPKVSISWQRQRASTPPKAINLAISLNTGSRTASLFAKMSRPWYPSFRRRSLPKKSLFRTLDLAPRGRCPLYAL